MHRGVLLSPRPTAPPTVFGPALQVRVDAVGDGTGRRPVRSGRYLGRRIAVDIWAGRRVHRVLGLPGDAAGPHRASHERAVGGEGASFRG